MPLKVKELIELLKKQSPDAEVWTEGCDCWGDANGVEVTEFENELGVLITRVGGEFTRRS